MCGVAGIFNRRDGAAVNRMLAAMTHRGPDGRGLYEDERIALGHLRLAIIDPTEGARQPMSAPDGQVTLSYNGEIYNFRDLRLYGRLRGYDFRTQSDTEVVLALYLAYGDDFLKLLRGMFALAIYDRRPGRGREKLLLARDPFGVKPLLYAWRGDALIFASEMKGMLASGYIEPEIDSAALQTLTTMGSVSQPDTLVRGVSALPSAHAMIVQSGRSRLQRYWSYGFDRVEGLRAAAYPEQVEAVAETLERSVKRQMVADVPVGAFLSGGVDSSLISALTARETNARVKTFSVGFETQGGAPDETDLAAETAARLETDHSRVIVRGDEVADALDAFVAGLDQPSVDGLNTYFVSRAAASAVKVSLSGTGADEVFCGYPWFGAMEDRFPDASGAVPKSDRRFWRRPPAVDTAPVREAFGDLYHCYGPSAGREILRRGRADAVAAHGYDQLLSGNDELPAAGVVDRASVLCLNGYTRNQLLRDIDACSMAHSLEVRVPFLDTELTDLAFSLPVAAKLRPGGERGLSASYDASGVKRVVVDVARRYLPSGFFAERNKQGFSLPHAAWLRTVLADRLEDTLSPRSVELGGLFDPQAVQAARQRFLAGEAPWVQPWLLMVTELWRRQMVEASRVARASPAWATDAVA